MIGLRRTTLVLIALLLFSTAALASLQDRWIHVRVQEHGGDDEYVAVNIPLQLVEALLPTIESDEIHGGRIVIDDDDMDDIDLRAALEALRDVPDGEFVTVRSRHDSVRVAKERGFLVVNAEDHDGEKARIRMPMAVVEAMIRGDGHEIDLLAALEALADTTDGDLITVESDDSHVRIWIDSNPTGE